MRERPMEICAVCGYATGHAGYGEDSIGYVDGTIGPLCNECNNRLRTEIECESDEIERLRSDLSAATTQLHSWQQLHLEKAKQLASCQELLRQAVAAMIRIRDTLGSYDLADIEFNTEWLAAARAAGGVDDARS